MHSKFGIQIELNPLTALTLSYPSIMEFSLQIKCDHQNTQNTSIVINIKNLKLSNDVSSIAQFPVCA